MKVTLAWPPKELSPNARLHWSKVAKAKQAYRQYCWASAMEAGLHQYGLRTVGDIHLTMTFVPPDKRGRDMDNMFASMKAGLDGLADCLKVNDQRFVFTLIKADQIGGYVTVEIV